MATSAQYEQQLNGITNQMNQFTPTNAGDVTNKLMARVNFFQPQIAEQQSIEQGAQSYLPKFMSDYYNKYGQGGSGPQPGAFNMLNYGLSDIGRQMGTANTIGNAIGVAGGNIKDLANSALGQYNAELQGYQQKYNNLMPLFQAQKQSEDAARARAAAMAAQSAVPFPSFPGGQPSAQGNNPLSRQNQASAAINAMQAAYKTGKMTPALYQQGINGLRNLGYDPSKINFGFTYNPQQVPTPGYAGLGNMYLSQTPVTSSFAGKGTLY